jgi:hypothetical protein
LSESEDDEGEEAASSGADEEESAERLSSPVMEFLIPGIKLGRDNKSILPKASAMVTMTKVLFEINSFNSYIKTT